jgi:hypothetical protein
MDPIITKLLEVWGLPAAFVIALGFAVKALYDRNNEIQDARLDEAKEYAKDVSEISTTLRSTMDSLTQAIHALMARK